MNAKLNLTAAEVYEILRKHVMDNTEVRVVGVSANLEKDYDDTTFAGVTLDVIIPSKTK